jgi:hypothetical protein
LGKTSPWLVPDSLFLNLQHRLGFASTCDGHTATHTWEKLSAVEGLLDKRATKTFDWISQNEYVPQGGGTWNQPHGPGHLCTSPLHLTVCSTDMRKIGRIGSREISASRCLSPLMKLGLLGLLGLLRLSTRAHHPTWDHQRHLTSPPTRRHADEPYRANRVFSLVPVLAPLPHLPELWRLSSQLHQLPQL